MNSTLLELKLQYKKDLELSKQIDEYCDKMLSENSFSYIIGEWVERLLPYLVALMAICQIGAFYTFINVIKIVLTFNC